MADLVSDIGEYLVSKGRATAIGTDLFLDYMPNEPDSAICITEYGTAGIPVAVSALSRRVQIFVRDIKASQAKRKVWEIFNDLDRPQDDRQFHLTPTRWTMAMAIQQPTPLGPDKNSRFQYVFNVVFTTYRD